MDNPGTYPLLDAAADGDFAIAGAAMQIGAWVEDLDGMLSATLQLALTGGAGGTKIQAFLQTSFDGGNTPVDIACITFANISKTVVRVLSATPRADLGEVTPQNMALADDDAVDGLLGDRLRLVVVSTGTYTGSTVLSARVCVR